MKADVTQEIWKFRGINPEGIPRSHPAPEYSLQRWSNLEDQWNLNELNSYRVFSKAQLLEFADWIKTVVINAES